VALGRGGAVQPGQQPAASFEPAGSHSRGQAEVGYAEAGLASVGLDEDRAVRAAQEAGALAGELVDGVVLDYLWQGDEGGSTPASRPGPGGKGGEVGMVVGGGADEFGGAAVGQDVRHASQHGVAGGGVDGVGVRDGADDAQSMGLPGQ